MTKGQKTKLFTLIYNSKMGKHGTDKDYQFRCKMMSKHSDEYNKVVEKVNEKIMNSAGTILHTQTHLKAAQIISDAFNNKPIPDNITVERQWLLELVAGAYLKGKIDQAKDT